jgi:hypothetical protein
MVMPLDLFVTPYTPVSQLPTAATGYKALGDFGERLSERAYRDKTFEEGKRQFDTQQARLTASDKETARYHQDEIDARREASRNAAEAKRDARVSKIIDMMRKAQDSNRWDEVASLRDELTRLGYATEESDTAFAPETPAPKIDIPPDVPSPKIPATKVPKASPGFKSALAAEMGKESPENPFGLTGSTIDAEDPAASPFPWEGLGMPAPAKKKGPGGRFTIKDREGNIVTTMDVPMEKEKDRQSIEASLAPYIDDPQNPESQGAAKRASEYAQRLIGTGMSPDKAVEKARLSYEAEMKRYKAQRLPSAPAPAGTGGSSLGVSKQEQGRLGAISDDARQTIMTADERHKLPQAREGLAAIDGMERALQKAGEDGFSGGAALSQYMKAISGATVTEGEVHRIMGGAGAMSEWETKLNRYTNGGKLDPDLIRGLKGVASRAREVFNARINGAIASTTPLFTELPGLATPEERKKQVKAMRGWFTGGRADEVTPAAKGSGRARADAWLESQGVK